MKALKIAVVTFLLACVGFSPSSAGDIFKSSDFLKWEAKNQAFYIETSVGMASLIAAQNNKQQATCIDDWYYSNEAAANNYLQKTMQDYLTYHPRGIILAVIEKKCGKF